MKAKQSFIPVLEQRIEDARTRDQDNTARLALLKNRRDFLAQEIKKRRDAVRIAREELARDERSLVADEATLRRIDEALEAEGGAE